MSMSTDAALLAKPFHALKSRVAHSQLWSHLEYHEHFDLGLRVSKRAAYALGLFDSHQQLTDCYNRGIVRRRPENAQPLPDTPPLFPASPAPHPFPVIRMLQVRCRVGVGLVSVRSVCRCVGVSVCRCWCVV
jgi:hypothetical protein